MDHISKYLTTIVSIAIITSCTNSELPDDPIPSVHDPIELDVDEDGIDDFTILYGEYDIEPLIATDRTFGIGAMLRPYGKNEVLVNTTERTLFLRNLNEIAEVLEDPLSWRSSFSNIIVFIKTINAEHEWPKKWDISTDHEHTSYFIGLKLVTDNLIQLGWIEIEVDANSGSISLINKGIL